MLCSEQKYPQQLSSNFRHGWKDVFHSAFRGVHTECLCQCTNQTGTNGLVKDPVF